MLPKELQETRSFGTCLFGGRCSWLQLIIPVAEVKCRNIHCTAKKEMHIPFVKRKSKVQDTGKALIHLFYNLQLQAPVEGFKDKWYFNPIIMFIIVVVLLLIIIIPHF